MRISDIPKDADGRYVITMTLVKRWTDRNGNSRGQLKFHVGEQGASGTIYDCSGWFRRSKDPSVLITGLAAGLSGVARRVEQDFKQRYGAECTIIYGHN